MLTASSPPWPAAILACALASCSRGAPAPAAAPAPAETRPASVLLITVDTLRADRVGAYGDTVARTPAIDALARAGVVFERAYTVAPATLPAHVSIMTGLLPPAHGVRGNVAYALPASGPPTLAEALHARGLRTAAFVGALPVGRASGLARGFDHFDDAFGRAPGIHYEFPERRADAVVEAARGWLARNPGPAFVWVHVFDPHAPYDPPAAFRGRDPYRGEIAFADSALATLMQAWDARPEPSVVALLADHGEAFGEHGEESHGLFVYDTTLHVPLVVRAPGLAPGREARAVCTADVAATLLARVGGNGGPALHGRDLLTPVPAGALYAETLAPQEWFGWSDLRAWRADGWKYVRAPRPELYHVVVDPDEARDLAREEPQRVAAMQAALETALRETPESKETVAIDAEAAERLRALGYAQGPAPTRGSGADPKDRREVARMVAQAAGPFADYAAAVRAYREIVARDPTNPLANLRLADALLRGGQPAQALAPFARVIESRPRSAEPYVGQATALAALDRLDEAAASLARALELEPANAQAHFNLGEIARVRHDIPGARRHYQAALGDPVTRARAEQRLKELP